VEYGYSTDLWSAERLADLIEQAFGVHFNSHYLSTWLRQRNYTPQKPQRIHRERDEEAIARWLTHDWPRLKQKARRRGACLLFLDESGLLMAPLLRRSCGTSGEGVGRGHLVAVAGAGPVEAGLSNPG
jgi:Winged helix-turn helix